jgi:cell division protein FtsN
MSKTEGEYELVLGNRQLLSAFFIIVILFGVFFTMGYVVGRNSAPASAASPASVPVAGSQRPDAASASPGQSAPTPSAPAESSASTPETKPAKPEPAETKPAAPPPGRQAPRKIETRVEVSTPPPRESARPASASGAVAVNPGPGNMYLQVAAAAQPQAGVVVDTLKQKGFPALLAQGPNATLFRVMVGPFADASTLGKAKSDLENAGFHPLVRK